MRLGWLQPEPMGVRPVVWVATLMALEVLLVSVAVLATPHGATPGRIVTPTSASGLAPRSTPIPGPASTTSVATPNGLRYGCDAAIAYLERHAAPGFRFVCPGYANGRQAMTCNLHERYCPSEKVIVIAVPCPAAYMNEAHNSWVLDGLLDAPLDPYGWCR